MLRVSGSTGTICSDFLTGWTAASCGYSHVGVCRTAKCPVGGDALFALCVGVVSIVSRVGCHEPAAVCNAEVIFVPSVGQGRSDLSHSPE